MRHKFLSLIVAGSLGLSVLPASAQLFDKMAGVDSNNTEQTESAAAPAANETIRESQPAATQKDSVSALADYLDGSQTLSGQFEQIVYSGRGEDVSSGVFRLKRPGMFDWQYTLPGEQRIISNGEKVYHYDQDLEQITIRPRSELAGDTAMNLLVGDTGLLQSFDVVVRPADEAPAQLRNNEQGLIFYQLKPKGQRDEIDQVWVVTHNGTIAAVYVDTGVGQQSLIVLRDVKRNAIISTGSFSFTPPDGVDVIGG